MSSGMLRIPFALRLQDQAMVGPEEVLRGAACGCICPSCRLPLIANQGDDKVAYFSHNTRGHDREVARSCTYSFYVSVAAMAKQLARQGLPVTLPAYRQTVEFPPHQRGAARETVLVTHQTTLEPTGIEIDVEVNGAICDVVIWHNEHRLALFLVHPEKHSPQMHKQALRDPLTGILEIELTGMALRYGELRAGEAFKAAVQEFLQHDLSSKRWIFHPREERLTRPVRERLEAAWNERRRQFEARPMPNPPPIAPQETRKVRYSCICGNQYAGALPGITNCPACRRPSNLYATTTPAT